MTPLILYSRGMAARVCGWCGNRVVMRPVQVDVQDVWRLNPNFALVTATYRCDFCHLLSVACLRIRTSGYTLSSVPYEDPEAVDRAIMQASSDEVSWRPLRSEEGDDFPDVPEPIKPVAIEASASHKNGQYRASVMLARAVIEAAAKMHDVSGSLYQKIEELSEKRILSPATVEAAHAIRDSGNAVAHGDFVDYVIEVSEEESADVLDLMRLVLQDAFQTLARAQRVREAAQSRRRGESGP